MNGRIEQAEVRFVATGNRSLGSIHAFHERKALYRSDTEALLSVVSARYQVMQSEEIGSVIETLRRSAAYRLRPQLCYGRAARSGRLPAEASPACWGRSAAASGASGAFRSISDGSFPRRARDEQSSSAALARDGSAQYPRRQPVPTYVQRILADGPAED
ncbi:hypothetical protein F01_230030 [Burkholderia cenocepacia]|jgi:hypothetical protein|nr:hypothetical protein F01_230030 [Burkholderia cenocepacia]